MYQPDQKTLRAAAPVPSACADRAGAAENRRKRQSSAPRKAAKLSVDTKDSAAVA